MPSLHDELLGETRAGACKLCTFLAQQDPATRAEWQRELALPAIATAGQDNVAHAAIVVALKRRNVSIEEASVRRHRSNHVAR